MANACEKCHYFPVRRCKCNELQLQAEIERLKAFAGEVGYFTYCQIEENVEDGDVKDLLHNLVQTGRELSKS